MMAGEGGLIFIQIDVRVILTTVAVRWWTTIKSLMDGHLHSNSTLIDVQIAGFKFEKQK